MENFKNDFYRISGIKIIFIGFVKNFLRYHEVRFLYYFRKNNKISKLLLRGIKKKYGLKINSNNIGRRLYIGHPYSITINPNAVLGENCNIHKGVTIGQENRGKRNGAPIIGNSVWIGVNATIVGNIKIGDNVLIAPNSFVNFDVPSNSIVIGNPSKIIHNDKATEGYINNKV